jgi:hypothetical protein
MPILNYTTTISPQKTVGEITALLAKAKAQAIMQEFDGFGTPSAVSFRINTEFGMMTFRLPANIQRVHKVMARDANIPRSQRTELQAARVAWRIVKDWLEAQCAMMQAGLVDVEQVFLPYAQAADGSTLYEQLRARRFDQLALPPSSES